MGGEEVVLTLPPSNVVPQCTTCTTLNQDLPSRTVHSWTNLSSKISWKKCNLEVRRAFCNTHKCYWSKSPKKSTKKKPSVKIDVLKNQLKKCKLGVRHAFCNTQKTTSDPKVRKGAPKTNIPPKIQRCSASDSQTPWMQKTDDVYAFKSRKTKVVSLRTH